MDLKGLSTRSIAPVLAIILAIMLLATTSRAETYTLEKCLQVARENRASITAAQGRERTTDAQVRSQFGRLLLPSVSASYGTSKDLSRDRELDFIDTNMVSQSINLDDEDFKSQSLSLRAGLTVFDGLSNINDYLGSRKQSKAAEFDADRAVQNLDLDVKTAYFTYLANVQNLAVQEEATKRSQEQLNLVQSRYDVGSASLSDVLKQKVQFGNDNLALLDARNAVERTRAQLAFTIGVDPSMDISFDTTYSVVAYSGTLDEAMEAGLSNHPGLKSAHLEVEAAKKYVSSSYGDYFPSLSLSASRRWSKSQSPDDNGNPRESRSTSTSYGLDVSWNIFDGFSRERSVVLQKVARNNAMADELELRNQVVRDIQTNYRELEKAREQVSVSEENVNSASEDMSLAREKYNLGSASILDLLDAQVSLKTAQVNLIRAQLDLNTAIANLENAMGVTQ